MLGKKTRLKSYFYLILFYLGMLLSRRYCACGNTINFPGNTLSESSCNVGCVGNPTNDLKCGAIAIMSIYEINKTTTMSSLYLFTFRCVFDISHYFLYPKNTHT
jgi:hypothetical protein